jgi:aerobic-type carbon monoxide dehydrogenase small subunit (CoxS/CutS family)/CO/xanthine dehydrogenase FAD-binding subunit
MLARGIRRYSRPRRVESALAALARGARPLAGGTRLLARDEALGEVVDLASLGWAELVAEAEGLRLGSMLRLEELAHSALAAERSSGLLGEAARAHSASPLIRGMASLGGEVVTAAHDSPVYAALLALDAELVTCGAEADRRHALGAPDPDASPSLVNALRIPVAPGGAALERLAVLPSAPSLVGVVAALWLEGPRVARARVVGFGLVGPPARLAAAERELEGRLPEEPVVAVAARAVAETGSFRDDAAAGAAWRRRVSEPLARRALQAAVRRAAAGPPSAPLRSWMEAPQRPRPCEQPLASAVLELVVNGRPLRQVVSAGTTLMELLRGSGLLGVKHGCETGECGACCVLVDGRPLAACLSLALAADGRAVETVEGLGEPGRLHPVQRAFVETGAIQCGYCTPAMELCAKALLEALPQPVEAEVRDALSGCLCRCTGYRKPVEAVLRAAAEPT